MEHWHTTHLATQWMTWMGTTDASFTWEAGRGTLACHVRCVPSIATMDAGLTWEAGHGALGIPHVRGGLT